MAQTDESNRDTGPMRGPRLRLQREAIVQLALSIADQEGLEAVSFRRLASELHATPMALYRHVRDKTDLLDAMVETLLGEVTVDLDLATGWPDLLRSLLESVGQLLEAHPCAAALLLRRPPMSPNVLRTTEATLEILHRAGFSPAEGMVIVQQLTTLLVARSTFFGHGAGSDDKAVDDAIPQDQYPRYAAAIEEMAARHDPAHERDFSVDLLIAGIEDFARRRAAPEP